MASTTEPPKLRFHADDGKEFPAWNKKKLSEVFSKITRKNIDRKIELVLTNSAEHGIIPQREYFDKDIASPENINGYYILNPNDFVYNPRKSKAAPYGPFQCYYGETPGVVSPLYTCLHPITKDCSQYLMRYFASAAWHRFVYDNGSVGARHDRVSMTDDILLNIPVGIPCLEEQQKIADFLSAYDKKISLQKERVETLKEQKEGLLQKMFPKEGETVPELRFPGFTGDWEQRKLGDLLQTLPFKQFLKEPEPDGKYEIIQQGNEPVIGFANGTPCGDYKDVVIFGDHTLSLYKPQHPFFVATDGVRIVKGQQDTDGYYLLSLLERYKPQSEGYKRYYSILADTNCITTYNTSEQEKIGVFFKLLDNLITLHQRKLETMQEIKKGLLQQMFC